MVTLFLATVIGWYLVITGILMLCRCDQIKSAMSDILANRGLFFILAIFTFIIGLLMVASHNIWIMGWPVVITLFSWLVLIGSLVRLFCQDTMMRVGTSFLNHPIRMRVVSIVFLIIGLFLLFHVYAIYF